MLRLLNGFNSRCLNTSRVVNSALRTSIISNRRAFTITRRLMIRDFYNEENDGVALGDDPSMVEAEYYKKGDGETNESINEGRSDDENEIDPDEIVSDNDLRMIESDLNLFKISKDKKEINADLYFADFTEAMGFWNFATLKFTQLVYEPDWSNAGSCVVLRLTTEEKECITYHDVQAAYEIEELLRKHFRHVNLTHNAEAYDEEVMQNEEEEVRSQAPRKSLRRSRGSIKDERVSRKRQSSKTHSEKEAELSMSIKELDDLKKSLYPDGKSDSNDDEDNDEVIEKYLKESGMYDELLEKFEVPEEYETKQKKLERESPDLLKALGEDTGLNDFEMNEFKKHFESMDEAEIDRIVEEAKESVVNEDK